jgi:hypothetical protein
VLFGVLVVPDAAQRHAISSFAVCNDNLGSLGVPDMLIK